jgi:hypothetical protein
MCEAVNIWEIDQEDLNILSSNDTSRAEQKVHTLSKSSKIN